MVLMKSHVSQQRTGDTDDEEREAGEEVLLIGLCTLPSMGMISFFLLPQPAVCPSFCPQPTVFLSASAPSLSFSLFLYPLSLTMSPFNNVLSQ